MEYHSQAQRECDFAEFWTVNRGAANVFKLNFVNSEIGGGVSTRKGWIKQGGNSGFQAVGLALMFGAARVILLGYDMQFTGGKRHWHRDHPETMGNPVERKFQEWRGHFEHLARQARVPIINASRETALRCFPRMDLDACLAEPAAHRS